MINTGWRLCALPSRLPAVDPLSLLGPIPEDWERWLAADGTPAGTPFLLDPDFGYDVAVNDFFRSAEMLTSALSTQSGYARDLAAFLTFVWSSRGGRGWVEATEADHTAYLAWRRFDEHGPRVAGATWNREVAAVNRFYGWQVAVGNVARNPIPQRAARRGRHGRRSAEPGSGRPATYSASASRDRVEWLPAASYRLWRDVGIRGHTAEGLPDPRFRGRWSGRNATFCDMLVRTGLRLSEQAGLSVFEVPRAAGSPGYQAFRLPSALAKGSSARRVYLPSSVAGDLDDYREMDRPELLAAARAAGRYDRIEAPLVIEDPARPMVTRRCGARVPLGALTLLERSRVLVDGPDGLEPAAFWLSELGLPVAVPTWKSIFRTANVRCESRGVALRAHPHMLRHTFAVITLEQLQRGHIAALASETAEQRGHYVRVFGDPLDWVRRLLGHRSVLTTQIYLHALAELEMETRMALVPDGWDDPSAVLLAGQAADRPDAGPLVGAAG